MFPAQPTFRLWWKPAQIWPIPCGNRCKPIHSRAAYFTSTILNGRIILGVSIASSGHNAKQRIGRLRHFLFLPALAEILDSLNLRLQGRSPQSPFAWLPPHRAVGELARVKPSSQADPLKCFAEGESWFVCKRQLIKKTGPTSGSFRWPCRLPRKIISDKSTAGNFCGTPKRNSGFG